MYQGLAFSCSTGPCPTLRQDAETGAVEVQGYVTTASCTIPAGEDVVLIPADAWARLLADLPLTMLLTALRGALRKPMKRHPTRPVAVSK